jgi:hypothetical protein
MNVIHTGAGTGEPPAPKESKVKKKDPKVVISNNEFVGVKWDDRAIRAVEMVAEGLLNLTRMFNAQDITIKSLLKVKCPKEKK